MKAIQLGSWKELTLHDVVWTAGDMLATRLFGEAADLLDKGKRRLFGDWFDVTPELAQQAISVAGTKMGIPTFTHAEMLQKVRAIRKSRIEAAMRS
jgi:hypothetical protein